MKTDAKTFVFVIYNRNFKNLCKKDKKQYACTFEKQTQTATRKLKRLVTLERLANRGSCALKTDSYKAIDRVDY